MPTVSSVVVGVDGSEDSLAAVDAAAAEAARRNLPLRLVHGFQWPALMPAGAVSPAAIEIDPLLEAEPILEEAALRASAIGPQVQLETDVVVGSPAAVLLDESRTGALVVIGSRGRGGFTGLLAGSVSSQVTTHAIAPVIVVRGRRPAEEAPVVLGLDAAHPSDAAIEFALDEAALRRVALRVVYAWSAPPPPKRDDPMAPPGYDYAEAEQEARRLLAEALAGWSERNPDVRIEREVSHSLDPPAVLTRASADAALIVVGSRGRGELRSLLLGSCGYTLIHHADCPVAIVPSG